MTIKYYLHSALQKNGECNISEWFEDLQEARAQFEWVIKNKTFNELANDDDYLPYNNRRTELTLVRMEINDDGDIEDQEDIRTEYIYSTENN